MHDLSFINPELMPWFMLLIAGFGIFIWRILGVTLSSKINKDGLFAKWINADKKIYLDNKECFGKEFFDSFPNQTKKFIESYC